MRDQRVERMADVLVGYSLGVNSGDTVHIKGPYVAEPLMLALYERCLKQGAHPKILASLPDAEALFYRHAADHQLEYIWPTDEWSAENVDVSITIIGETNTRSLSRIDPGRQVVAARARKPLMDTFMRRASDGGFRWAVTLFPTEAHAMEAEMSLDEYEDFFFRACLVDADDPAAEWQKVAERHARLLEWMDDHRELHIEGHGTDLRLDVEGRKWIPCDGTTNFPDGEIFTGPNEAGTEGYITFTYPASYRGRSVEGIRLGFEDGRVVEASAGKNEDFLLKALDADAGARVLGEIGIGTNYGIVDFSGESLLDEKIGGTIHLAVGASYPESGGVNESAIHWDMVCDLRRGGRITLDGDVLMEDGILLF
jgi:aminopeptidase